MVDDGVELDLTRQTILSGLEYLLDNLSGERLGTEFSTFDEPPGNLG